MNTNIVRALYKKEMKDLFRDKKTIIVMVLVPMVLYPLVMFGSMIFTTKLLTQSTEKSFDVAIVDVNDSYTDTVQKILDDSLEKNEYHFNTTYIKENEDYDEMVRNEEYDCIIEPLETDGEYPDFNLYFLTSDNDSSTAFGMVDDVLEEYFDSIVDERVRGKIPDFDEISNPFKVNRKDCSKKEETAGMLIGMILPFILVESLMVGAFYPAIDVSAGERERGTLETLMTLPVKNIEMMISKFMATSTMAVISALLNLLSMSLVGAYMLSSMAGLGLELGDFNIASFVPVIPILLVILVLFSLFTSALCLCVFFMAKSYKEANNLSTPIMLVFMFGSMVSIAPGIELNMTLAWIPVVNVSLLIKALFLLKFDATLIAIVIVSNVLLTALIIFAMTKIFSSEDILFGEGIRGVTLFEKRVNLKEKSIPGIGDLIVMAAVLLLLMIYASNGLTLKLGIWGTAVTHIVIFAVPVFYAWYMKADFKKLFSIGKPRIIEFVGAAVMFCGLFILEQLLSSVLMPIFPSIGETNEAFEMIFDDAGFVPCLIVVGLIPAVSEETVFRGFIFGTLKDKKKIPIIVSMIISAVLFGAYHMNLAQFITASIMGTFMAYMVYNSESIFVSSFYHSLNNTFAVVASFYPVVLEKIPGFNQENPTTGTIILMVIAGFVLLSLGFMISDRKVGFFRVKKIDG